MNLKLTKTKLKALKKKNLDYCLGGSECKYIQITLTCGIKLFDSLFERNYSYKSQKHAFANGFGPQVGTMFKVKINNKTYYCYITEHALPFVSHVLHDYSLQDRLIETMKTHGFKTDDYDDETGARNLGFCKDKIVCLDFGPLSREGKFYEF